MEPQKKVQSQRLNLQGDIGKTSGVTQYPTERMQIGFRKLIIKKGIELNSKKSA